MPKSMWPSRRGFDASRLEAEVHHVADRTRTQRQDRFGVQPKEERRPQVGRTNLFDIARESITDSGMKNVDDRLSSLVSRKANRLILPIDVLQPERGDLPPSRAVDGEQHENGSIPYMARRRAADRRQQCCDLLFLEPSRQARISRSPNTRHHAREAEINPAAIAGET